MSTNYIARPGTGAAFADLCKLELETDGAVLTKAVKDASTFQLVDPGQFSPDQEYALTDERNWLHLNFGPDGKVVSADRYGANNVEELLNHVGDMAAEDDDDYWDVVDQVEGAVPEHLQVVHAAEQFLREAGPAQVGTVDRVDLTFRGFGEQYTTIDGVTYVTFADFRDTPLKRGVKVEFVVTPGPTKLCDAPLVTVPQPTARILKVL